MARIEIGDRFYPKDRPPNVLYPTYVAELEYTFKGKRHIVGYYDNHGQRIGIDSPEDQLWRYE